MSPTLNPASITYVFNWAIPGLFLHLFASFQTNITIFATNICGKGPSSTLFWDSNPQPSEHSPSLTTRPDLPPLFCLCLFTAVLPKTVLGGFCHL